MGKVNEKVQLLMELKKLQKALRANFVSVAVLKFCYKKDPGLASNYSLQGCSVMWEIKYSD